MELSKILNELQQYKVTDREQVLTQYINLRLNESLNTYYNELDKSISYLNTKNEVKLLKKINTL